MSVPGPSEIAPAIVAPASSGAITCSRGAGLRSKKSSASGAAPSNRSMRRRNSGLPSQARSRYALNFSESRKNRAALKIASSAGSAPFIIRSRNYRFTQEYALSGANPTTPMQCFSGVSRDALKKPRFGVTPVAFHRAGSNVDQLRDFAFLEPDEEPELYHFRLVGRQRGKFIQRRIDLQETVVVGRRLDLDVGRIDTHQLGAVPCALLFPGAFDQNMAHRLSGGSVEMFAALPLHRL